MVPVDLESVTEELYAGSPDDFIELRRQRVADAREARDRPLAKSIGQLRRPTRSAWMVNVLARAHPESVAELLALGGELADAQSRGAGADLRRLSQQRHQLLDGLTRRAVGLAQSSGHAAAEASRLEVTQTLQAALADKTVAELVRRGRVTQPVTYAGFGPMELGVFAAAAPSPEVETEVEPAVGSEPAAQEGLETPAQRQPEAEDLARLEAEDRVRSAAEVLRASEDEAAEAEREAVEATDHADALADQVEVLQSQLQQAEADERAARDAARAARRVSQQRAESLAAAQAAFDEARLLLAEIAGGGRQ